jgi:hypothetical protein
MPEMINSEAEQVKNVAIETAFATAKSLFQRENASVLYYNPKN